MIQLQGIRYSIGPRALFGDVDWVRNLRAAGTATLTRGQHVETVTARELTAEETGPILKAAFKLAPGLIRSYYDVTADAPLADFVREAQRHPCFELVGASHPAQASTSGPNVRREA